MGVSNGLEFIGLKMQLLGGKITRVIVGLQQFHGWLLHGWLDSFAPNSPSETPVEAGGGLKLLLINVQV